MPDALDGIGKDDLIKIVRAALAEWGGYVGVSSRGAFVDFTIGSPLPLSLIQEQRVRLFFINVSAHDLQILATETDPGHRAVAITPLGLAPGTSPPSEVTVLERDELVSVLDQSGNLTKVGGRYILDPGAYLLARRRDDSLLFSSALKWLGPLSRDRRPPSLRGIKIEPDELFERCFFAVMTMHFRALGQSWGTGARGKSLPDGVLNLSGEPVPVLYDCKASYLGYSMEHRDATGFAEYVKNPPQGTVPAGVTPRFLIVSSRILPGLGAGSFEARQRLLQRLAPGTTLTWINVPDLVRFGLSLERARVIPAHRDSINWGTILDAGQVSWETFAGQIDQLRSFDYSIDT